jgi:hypothetical protein
MVIELTTRAAAHALTTYLEACGCTVEAVGDCRLEVALPEQRRSAQEAAIEMDAYLRVWRVIYPMHGAVRVDPTR